MSESASEILRGVLKRLYVTQKLTAEEVGEIIGVDRHIVCRNLKKYGYLRSKSEISTLRWSERRNLPEPEQIRHLYWDKGLNVPDIGGKFGVPISIVYAYMKRHNIPCRPNRGGDGGAIRSKPSSFLGKHHTEEANEMNRLAHIGKPSPRLGAHLSDETKRKIGEAQLDRIAWWIERGLPNPRAYSTEPTKPERILIKVIEEHGLPFRYVGNGQVILGGLNPDFINVNGEKQIIEVFGDYWHNLPDIEYHRTEKGRREAYLKFGYTTMILWEHDLYLMESKDIAQKVLQFETLQLEGVEE